MCLSVEFKQTTLIIMITKAKEDVKKNMNEYDLKHHQQIMCFDPLAMVLVTSKF